MKPKKENLVFCPAAHRSKLQFETRTKAMAFIRFNKDAIKEDSGEAPVRAYYCNSCGCWHTTKNRVHRKRTPHLDPLLSEGWVRLVGYISQEEKSDLYNLTDLHVDFGQDDLREEYVKAFRTLGSKLPGVKGEDRDKLRRIKNHWFVSTDCGKFIIRQDDMRIFRIKDKVPKFTKLKGTYFKDGVFRVKKEEAE